MRKLPELFGNNLKRIRREKGFRTQEDLAKAADLSVGIVKNAEAAYGLPSHKNIELIARALGVDEAVLFQKEVSTEPGIETLSKVIAEQEARIKELEAQLPRSPLIEAGPVVIEGGVSEDRRWLLELANRGSDQEIRVAVAMVRDAITKRRLATNNLKKKPSSNGG